jgi:hypothetical protein
MRRSGVRIPSAPPNRKPVPPAETLRGRGSFIPVILLATRRVYPCVPRVLLTGVLPAQSGPVGRRREVGSAPRDHLRVRLTRKRALVVGVEGDGGITDSPRRRGHRFPVQPVARPCSFPTSACRVRGADRCVGLRGLDRLAGLARLTCLGRFTRLTGFAPIGEKGVDRNETASEQYRSDRGRQPCSTHRGRGRQHHGGPRRHRGCEGHGGALPRLIRIGMTVKTRSPGLFRNQPPTKPASMMGERLDGSAARQARATPDPRITAPGRTFIVAPPHGSSRARGSGAMTRHSSDAPRAFLQLLEGGSGLRNEKVRGSNPLSSTT